jgi:3-isopropylmalate/(R)-2-methylmalate dehydratase small subunit
LFQKGKAFKFGDNISTDLIIPGKYLHLDFPEMAKHIMEDADPNFAPRVNPGDFIVGGRNFGLGSSREAAPMLIKQVGCQAVVAKSFARLFFRNCFNVGLPALVCDTDKIRDQDDLEIFLEQKIIRDLTNGNDISFIEIPGIMIRILQEGGLFQYAQKHPGLDF